MAIRCNMRSEFIEKSGVHYLSFKYAYNKLSKYIDMNQKSGSELNLDKIVEFIKFVNQFNPSIKNLIVNHEKIKSAYSYLSDDYSRGVFLRQISFPILQACLGDAIAHQFCDHKSEMVLENMSKTLIKEGGYEDELDGQKNFTEGRLRHSVGYIFAMEQYTYENKYLDESVRVGVDKDDICYDVGACIGDTSIWMTKYKKAKKAYAFEIAPEAVKQLEINIKKNNLQDKIFIEQVALSNEDKNDVTMFINDEFVSRGFLSTSFDSASDNKMYNEYNTTPPPTSYLC